MQYALVLKVDTSVVKNLFINCTYFTVDPFCNEKVALQRDDLSCR